MVGEGKATDSSYKIAEEVGKRVAQAGAILICGGLSGVMEAAAKGAKSAGGITVGILPGDSRKQANKYIDIPIVTGMGFARNVAVVKSGQVVIAVGGQYGTLSEIAHALSMNIPVIGIGTWQLRKNAKVDKRIIVAKNAKEAVRLALKIIK